MKIHQLTAAAPIGIEVWIYLIPFALGMLLEELRKRHPEFF